MTDEPLEDRKIYAIMEFFAVGPEEGGWALDMQCDCAQCKYNVIFALKKAIEKLEGPRLH